MKKSYLLTVIWVFTLLFTNSLNCNADWDMDLNKEFTAHWASYLPDSTRLCDLSIACAHDAATWDADLGLWEDQEYDERQLFDMGVRAFDMRINKNGHYEHGNDLIERNRMKTFGEEQVGHMPTKEQLKDEFMILFFQYEGGKDGNDGEKDAFNQWLDKGLFTDAKLPYWMSTLYPSFDNNAYDPDMFVRYHKDMTLGDIRGKILVIRSEKNDTLSEAEIVKPEHKIPIALINEDQHWICDSKDCLDYNLNNTPADKKNPFNMAQRTSVTQDEKMDSIKYYFDRWFSIYNNTEKNKDGIINLHMLNSYYWEHGTLATGAMICRDGLSEGTNHFTYDYLKNHHEPYGILWCDYLGYDGGWFGTHYYGDKLLERIILNNFYSNGKGKYISDLMVLMNTHEPLEEDTREMDQMIAQGWKFTNIVTPGVGDVKNAMLFTSSTIIGYKTTDDINQAITDVILTKDFANNYQDSIVGPCGHKYHKPLIHSSFYGKWLSRIDLDNAMYLYYTKEHGTDSVTNKVITAIDVVDNVCDTCTYAGMWFPESQTVSKWENVNPLIINKARYINYSSHRHEYFLNNDSISHYDECVLCGMKINNENHTLKVNQGDAFHHVYNCAKCGYSRYKQCTASSYDTDGLAKCKVCNNYCAQKPINGKHNGVYLWYIDNPGNLYWYAANTNRGNYNDCAVLAADITITNKIMSAIPWVPIGTTAKAVEKYLNADGTLKTYTDDDGVVKPLDEYGGRFGEGFNATFNGNRHTISINYDGGTKYPASGIFGYINGGTVKNLGIVNSSFKGYDYVGSLAGKIDSATIQNVYITASIANTSNSVYQGGIAGCVGNKTKISNGYYVGDAKLFGEISGEATEVKNFFTSNENDATATYATDEQFANGNVCYMLNDSTYDENAVWHQNIDACEIVEGGYQPDKYPVLTSSHSMVIPAMYNGKDLINLNRSYNSNYKPTYSRDDFSVDDKYNYSCPVDFKVKKATQTRDVTGYKYGTVCLPFDIDHAVNNEIHLYKIVGIQEGSNPAVIVDAVDKLPACTPAIFVKQDQTENIVKFVSDGCTVSASDPGCRYYSYSPDNSARLIGSFSNDTLYQSDYEWYKYYFNIKDSKFQKLGSEDNLVVAPYRCWIENHNNTYGQYYILPLDPSAIKNVEEDDVIDARNVELPVYDISGRKIVVPFKGEIIIRKGKKIINK